MATHQVRLDDEREATLAAELQKTVGRKILSDSGERIPLPAPMTADEKVQKIVENWCDHKAAVVRKRVLKDATPEEIQIILEHREES